MRPGHRVLWERGMVNFIVILSLATIGCLQFIPVVTGATKGGQCQQKHPPPVPHENLDELFLTLVCSSINVRYPDPRVNGMTYVWTRGAPI